MFYTKTGEGAKVVRPDESLCQFNVRTATPDWESKKIISNSQEQHLITTTDDENQFIPEHLSLKTVVLSFLGLRMII